MGVAQDVDRARLRQPLGDVDHLAPVGQGQVEDGGLAEEPMGVVQHGVRVPHADPAAGHGRDTWDTNWQWWLSMTTSPLDFFRASRPR